MKEFRQLTVADTAEYHKVLIDGYAAIKDYPIHSMLSILLKKNPRHGSKPIPYMDCILMGNLLVPLRSVCRGLNILHRINFPHCSLCNGT